MELMVGKVIEGKVVVDAPLEEGTSVTVLARRGEETFELDAQAETEMLAAMAEADRGVFVDGAELLQELRSRE